MRRPQLPKLRFSVKALLVLVLGIAIGFSLNLQTWKMLTGRSLYAPWPEYVIEPPDTLEIDIFESGKQWTVGNKFLVGPDGRVNLQKLGTVYVAGMTIEEARSAIEKQVAKSLSSPRVALDVAAYNSKTYYVISKLGQADSVSEFPITGNETVLDALAAIGGITLPRPVQISISRPAPNGIGGPSTLTVDWEQIASGRSTDTNYLLHPRDRLIISQLKTAVTSP